MTLRLRTLPKATILFFMGLAAVAGANAVHAVGLEFRQAGDYVLNADEVQDRELWLAADHITVHGVMEESFFGVADSADLSGRFDKDVWVTAKEILFDGRAGENARFAARNSVVLHGQIESSLMAVAARTVKIDSQSVVRRDALLVAPNVLVQGHIGGRAAIWAKRAVISGPIDGTLHVRAEDITFLRGASIGGDLIYTAPRDLVLDERVPVGGRIERRDLPATGVSHGQHVLIQFFLFGAALVTGLLFTAGFPRYTGHAVRRIRLSFWTSALTGSLAFFLLPAAAALAMLTIIGLPAGALIALVYGILLYLSKIVVALALGGVLMQRRGPQPYFTAALTLAVGLLLLYFLAGLPIVGSVVTIAILFIGLGGLILGWTDVQYVQRPPPLRGAQASQPRTHDALSQEP